MMDGLDGATEAQEPPDPIASEVADDPAPRKRRFTGDDAIFWVAVAAIIVSGLSAVIGWVQWSSIDEQQTIIQRLQTVTQNQLKEEQDQRRPWITSDSVVAGPMVLDDASLSLTIKTTMENTGSAPANNILAIPRLVALQTRVPFSIGDVLAINCSSKDWDANSHEGDALFKDQVTDRTMVARLDKKTYYAHEGSILALIQCVYYKNPDESLGETGRFYWVNFDGRGVMESRKGTVTQDKIYLRPQGSFAK